MEQSMQLFNLQKVCSSVQPDRTSVLTGKSSFNPAPSHDRPPSLMVVNLEQNVPFLGSPKYRSMAAVSHSAQLAMTSIHSNLIKFGKRHMWGFSLSGFKEHWQSHLNIYPNSSKYVYDSTESHVDIPSERKMV